MGNKSNHTALKLFTKFEQGTFREVEKQCLDWINCHNLTLTSPRSLSTSLCSMYSTSPFEFSEIKVTSRSKFESSECPDSTVKFRQKRDDNTLFIMDH